MLGLDKQGADALKRAKQEEYRRQLDQMQPSTNALQMQDNRYRPQGQQQPDHQLNAASSGPTNGLMLGLDKQGVDAMKRAKQEEYRRQLDQMQPSTNALQMQDNRYRPKGQQQPDHQLNASASGPTNGLMLGLDKQGADALKRAKQEEYRRQLDQMQPSTNALQMQDNRYRPQEENFRPLDQQQYLQPLEAQRQSNYFKEDDHYVPSATLRSHDDHNTTSGPKYMSRGDYDRASKRAAAEEYRRDLDRQLEEKRLRTVRDKEAEDLMDSPRPKPTQDDSYKYQQKKLDQSANYIVSERTAPSNLRQQASREGPFYRDDRFTVADDGYDRNDDNRREGDFDAHDALQLDAPLVADQSSNRPTPRKSPVKSPNQARARFMQDIYGGDNLIARVESDASTTWKPSGRTADVRHKQVILGQKAALDAQIREVRARKEKEKADARLEDEKQELKIREALASVAEQARKEKEKVRAVCADH